MADTEFNFGANKKGRGPDKQPRKRLEGAALKKAQRNFKKAKKSASFRK